MAGSMIQVAVSLLLGVRIGRRGVVGGNGEWLGEVCGGENSRERSSDSRRPSGISRSSKGCLRFIKVT